MGKLTKNRKLSEAKIDNTKLYNLDEACSLIKDITTTKFDASVDLAVRLGVDPKKANEMVRGVVSLPNGTGKDMKVLALVSPSMSVGSRCFFQSNILTSTLSPFSALFILVLGIKISVCTFLSSSNAKAKFLFI